MIPKQRCSLWKAFTQPLARIAPITQTIRFYTPRRLCLPLSSLGAASFTNRPTIRRWWYQHNIQRPKSSLRGISTSEPPESPYDTETWPADGNMMKKARRFLLECAADPGAIVLVTDRRCRSMSAATLVRETLKKLGKDPDRIWVVLTGEGPWPYNCKDLKEVFGSNVDITQAKYTIYVNPAQQRWTESSPLSGASFNGDFKSSLIISEEEEMIEFPDWAEVLTTSQSPPVTASILTYIICSPLVSSMRDRWYEKAEVTYVWLAFIGSLSAGNSKYNFEHGLYPPGLNTLRDGQKWMKKLVTMLDGLAMQKEGDLTKGWEFLQMVSAERLPAQEIKELYHEARLNFNKSLGGHPPGVRDTVIRPHERNIMNLLRPCLEKQLLLENMTDTLASTPLMLAQSWDKQITVSTINTPFRIENAIAALMATKPMKCSLVGCVNMGFLDQDGVVHYSFRQLNDEPQHNSVKRKRQDSTTQGMVKDIGGLLWEYAARDEEFSKRLRDAEQAKEVKFCKVSGRVAKGKLTAELWVMFMEKCLNVGSPWEYNLGRSKKQTEKEQQAKPKLGANTVKASNNSSRPRAVRQQGFFRLSGRSTDANEDAKRTNEDNPQDGDESNKTSRPQGSTVLWSEIERIINDNYSRRSQNKSST